MFPETVILAVEDLGEGAGDSGPLILGKKKVGRASKTIPPPPQLKDFISVALKMSFYLT